MNRFTFNNWEVITTENFENQLAQSIEATDHVKPQTLYCYRAPMIDTKMLGYLPKTAVYEGITESLDLLYNHEPVDTEMILSLNLNWFEQKVGEASLEAIDKYLEMKISTYKRKKRVTLLGLGDVGSMLAIGLKLLGGDTLESLGIYDVNASQKSRWEMELSQITVNPKLKIHSIQREDLFDGDMFIFCASKFVPKVGEEGKDVRMAQYEENAMLIAQYAVEAREAGYKGVFAVVSDPVDLLCKKVWQSSNISELEGVLDFKGLLPEQVIGFGLGVMDGRAHYYSDLLGMQYSLNGRVFGPHGKDLVVSEDIKNENQENSLVLTERVVTANLEMRSLGYKPYIAPAISSGANSIVKLLSGEQHYSAHFVNGIYWGTSNKMQPYGVEFEPLMISNALLSRIKASYNKLGDIWKELNS